jgi:hypothetical protein
VEVWKLRAARKVAEGEEVARNAGDRMREAIAAVDQRVIRRPNDIIFRTDWVPR